jgi:hypothetical protein
LAKTHQSFVIQFWHIPFLGVLPQTVIRNWAPGLFYFVLGLMLLVLRKWAGKQASKWNYRFLGVRIPERYYYAPFAMGGVLFIIIGLMIVGGALKGAK